MSGSAAAAVRNHDRRSSLPHECVFQATVTDDLPTVSDTGHCQAQIPQPAHPTDGMPVTVVLKGQGPNPLLKTVED